MTRHLTAVPASASAPAPLAGTVSISTERYVELLTLEILAAEVAAKTWQHQVRGHKTAAVGFTVALSNAVDPELVDAHLSAREQTIRREQRAADEGA